MLAIKVAMAQAPSKMAAPIKVYIRASRALVIFSGLPRAATKRKPQ